VLALKPVSGYLFPMRRRILFPLLFFCIQGSLPAQTAAELITSADTAWRHNLPEIAGDHFQRALALKEITPAEQATALLGLVRVHLQDGRTDSARGLLSEFPANAPENLQESRRLLQAELLLRENSPAEALRLLDSPPALQGPPGIVQLQLKARALAALERTDEAIQLLNSRLEEQPEPALQTELAGLLAARNLLEPALALWQTLAEGDLRDPHTREALLHLARHHLIEGNPGTSLELLTPLIETGNIPREFEIRLYPVWIAVLKTESRFTEAAEYLLAWEQILPAGTDPMPLQLRRASALLDAGDIQPAETLLRQLIATRGDDPRLAAVWMRLAGHYRETGQPRQAEEAYETHLSVFTDPPGTLQATLGLAEITLERGLTGEARILFERAWNLTPEDSPLRPRILLKWADTDYRHGDLQTARARYQKFIRLHGSEHELYPRARFQAALCLATRETLNEALRELTQLRLDFPDHPVSERALLQQAVLLVRFFRLEQAIGLFDTYLSEYPDGEFVADALTDKGLAAYRMGFFEMALRHFGEVLERFPGHPRAEQAFFMRGWALYLLENIDEALQVGETFLANYPDSPFRTDVHFWLGEHAFNRGDFETAGHTFLRVAGKAETPEIRSRAYYLAGRAAMGRGGFQEALEHFSRSLEANRNAPHSPETLFHQGDALTELNRFDDAILVFNQLIQRYPATTLALAAKGRIGDCHFTLGERQDPARLQQALAFYRLVEESSGAPPNLRFQALYKIALTLQTLGRTDEALSQYLLVIHRFRGERNRLDPETAAYFFNRAATSASQLFEQRQDWRGAIQIYREIVASGIQPAAREAAERIQNLRREHRILF
jgi:tetratricopeptide (TPR) repeat protein